MRRPAPELHCGLDSRHLISHGSKLDSIPSLANLLDIEFKPGCRGLADLGAKDKFAGLPAACVAGLQCAPFVISSAWAASPEQMAEELAAYSINLESSVGKASDPACWHAPTHHWQGCWQVSDLSCLLHWCYISDALIGWHCAQQEAVAAMKRIVRAMPAARSVLIAGLAAAYAGLSDDFPEVHCSLPLCFSVLEDASGLASVSVHHVVSTFKHLDRRLTSL